MTRSFLNRTDAELLAWSNSFSSQISATPTAFGISAPLAANYASLNASYASAYAVVQNPTTKTKVTVSAKDQARVNLKFNASLLAKLIEGTATVTVQQKLALGLPVRIRPTPVPAPSSPPLVDFVSTVGRTITIRVTDSVTPTRKKPVGVKSATVMSFVGATPPPSGSGWKYEGATTKATFDITFPDSVANGALVWISTFWNNDKLQSGPTSTPVSINIPGGGMSMAA